MKLICNCGAEIPDTNITFGNHDYDFEPDGMCGEAGHACAKCDICGEVWQSDQDVRESGTYAIDDVTEAKEYLSETFIDLLTIP